MHRKQKVSKNSGKNQKATEAFHQYFRSIYGERWDQTLLPSMLKSAVKGALMNMYCSVDVAKLILSMNLVSVEEAMTLLAKTTHSESTNHASDMAGEKTSLYYPLRVYISACVSKSIPPPIQDEHNIVAFYLLDLASLASVRALDVQKNSHVLDLCAAPGGKSIAIAQLLSSGTLTCNEPNAARRKRLQQVLKTHISHVLLPSIFVTERDATRWHAPDKYDRVLVDVPCGSERHVLQQSDSDFSTLQPKTPPIAHQQRSMLCQALETVREGGRVVYSTCSLNPEENDEVVESTLKRTRVNVRVIDVAVALPYLFHYAEKTRHGWIFLPDRCPLYWGPLYVCVLDRLPGVRRTNQEETSESDSPDSSDEKKINVPAVSP